MIRPKWISSSEIGFFLFKKNGFEGVTLLATIMGSLIKSNRRHKNESMIFRFLPSRERWDMFSRCLEENPFTNVAILENLKLLPQDGLLWSRHLYLCATPFSTMAALEMSAVCSSLTQGIPCLLWKDRNQIIRYDIHAQIIETSAETSPNDGLGWFSEGIPQKVWFLGITVFCPYYTLIKTNMA